MRVRATKKINNCFTRTNVSIKSLDGFTIIEVIATMVITVVILTIILGVYISFNKLYVTESNIADAQKNNIFIMNGITNEVQRAKNILATSTINGTVYETGTSTVVLAYPVFDTSQELIVGVSDYGALTFKHTSSTVLFDLQTDVSSARISNTKVLGSNVQDLLFRFNSVFVTTTKNVTVVLTTFGTDRGRTNTVSQSNSVSLRND